MENYIREVGEKCVCMSVRARVWYCMCSPPLAPEAGIGTEQVSFYFKEIHIISQYKLEDNLDFSRSISLHFSPLNNFWAQLLILPHTGFVTVDRLLNFSE